MCRKYRRLIFEPLESRQLLAGDLFYDPGAPGSFDRLVFVAADGSDPGVPDTTPVVGQKVYVNADWSAVGLGVGEFYDVDFEMDGVKLDPFSFTDASYPGLFHGGWIAQPGTTHTITITLDPNNTVAETDETNNTFSLQFTTKDADSLLTKFMTPIEGEQNVDWVLGGYVDVDPLFFPNAEDFQGNTTTTREFHNGHDFDIANFAAQDAGVNVLAAAPGIVIDIHDGDFDRETALTFSNVGNYVFIDHGNGWVSQYYHFRRDSITVAVNDTVTAGQVLGLVGSSGNSAGPHLHFEVQHLGSPVETFLAPEQYFIPADFDNSGQANGADFLDWARGFGQTSGATKETGDANGDGAVNALDLGVFQSEFGSKPLPYVFDDMLPNNLLDFGVTNDIQDGVGTGFGLPLEQFIERPSEVTAFPGSGEWILAWAKFTSVEAGDTWKAQLYRPNGTLVNDFAAATFAVDRPTDTGLYNPGFTENTPGTWRVDFLYNDVKIGERFFQVGTSAPEMRVFEDTNDIFILDGRSTPIDFGSVVNGQPGLELSFKIENHGYANLSISSVQVPTGFTITKALASTIAAGASDTFTVRLDSAVNGLKTGMIQIDSNDADEGVFTFDIEGEVTASLAAATSSGQESSLLDFRGFILLGELLPIVEAEVLIEETIEEVALARYLGDSYESSQPAKQQLSTRSSVRTFRAEKGDRVVNEIEDEIFALIL